MEEKVVLVNPNDDVLGVMEKMQAHQNGLLHRPFQYFYLIRKAKCFYSKEVQLSTTLQTNECNACCSHPRENETYLDGARRRIHEELGIKCELEEKFHFIYKADVGQGLWEHELDHVFIGTYNGEYQLNPDEVSAIRFVTMEELDEEIANKPELFTEWFKIIWDEYRHHL